ncbi:hypothetical protein [Ruminococcus sp.]|uniref:hypothetical protein n=1 Tax=Ruminococcus sp. TaxID=41978 RepID=UPI0025E3A999|nr:hypothetical protein [Ruminococcus sp.]MCR4637613.1 hypothetical protein [Ruminococcus sp.]
MAQKEIIDRDTYKKIKKMDRETLTKFILQYGDELLGNQGNVIKLTENDKEAGVCLYVSEQTPANTYSKTA